MKISKIAKGLAGIGVFFAGLGSVAYFGKKSLKKEVEVQKRYRRYYELTNRWLVNHSEGKNITEYFIENDIKSIAIYGMGTLGELFYNEIEGTGIDIKCFIDKNAEELYYGRGDKPVVGLEELREQEEKVDAIVVTPVFDFEEIENGLRENHITANIISLEDVIYG